MIRIFESFDNDIESKLDWDGLYQYYMYRFSYNWGRYGKGFSVDYIDDFEETCYDDYEDLYDDEGNLDMDKYNSILSVIKKKFDILLDGVSYYRYSNDIYLELHDNHTLFELDGDNFDEYLYYDIVVSDAIDAFEEDTGVDLCLLGRSDRHVCVENTFENLCRYKELKAKAEQLERSVIYTYNDMINDPDYDEE